MLKKLNCFVSVKASKVVLLLLCTRKQYTVESVQTRHYKISFDKIETSPNNIEAIESCTKGRATTNWKHCKRSIVTSTILPKGVKVIICQNHWSKITQSIVQLLRRTPGKQTTKIQGSVEPILSICTVIKE